MTSAVKMQKAGYSIGALLGAGAVLSGALMNTIGATTIHLVARIAVPTILGAGFVAGMAVGGKGSAIAENERQQQWISDTFDEGF